MFFRGKSDMFQHFAKRIALSSILSVNIIILMKCALIETDAPPATCHDCSNTIVACRAEQIEPTLDVSVNAITLEVGERKTFTVCDPGSQDRVHFKDGDNIPWCGINPKYFDLENGLGTITISGGMAGEYPLNISWNYYTWDNNNNTVTTKKILKTITVKIGASQPSISLSNTPTSLNLNEVSSPITVTKRNLTGDIAITVSNIDNPVQSISPAPVITPSTISGASGSFTIKILTAGNYRVTARSGVTSNHFDVSVGLPFYINVSTVNADENFISGSQLTISYTLNGTPAAAYSFEVVADQTTNSTMKTGAPLQSPGGVAGSVLDPSNKTIKFYPQVASDASIVGTNTRSAGLRYRIKYIEGAASVPDIIIEQDDINRARQEYQWFKEKAIIVGSTNSNNMDVPARSEFGGVVEAIAAGKTYSNGTVINYPASVFRSGNLDEIHTWVLELVGVTNPYYTSSWRCPYINLKAGSNWLSKHLAGQAADVRPSGINQTPENYQYQWGELGVFFDKVLIEAYGIDNNGDGVNEITFSDPILRASTITTNGGWHLIPSSAGPSCYYLLNRRWSYIPTDIERSVYGDPPNIEVGFLRAEWYHIEETTLTPLDENP
jgi:hypothetical protein